MANKKTTYIVDTENQSDIITLFKNVENSNYTKIIFVISEQTPHIPVNDLFEAMRMTINFSYELYKVNRMKGKNNEVDFAVSTIAGYLMAKNPERKYIIVSMDKEYKIVKDYADSINVDMELKSISEIKEENQREEKKLIIDKSIVDKTVEDKNEEFDIDKSKENLISMYPDKSSEIEKLYDDIKNKAPIDKQTLWHIVVDNLGQEYGTNSGIDGIYGILRRELTDTDIIF